MAKATEVFTPTEVPTVTYVERLSRNYEEDLRQAFTIPKMIVSVSGPSKSGKTVLVTKVVGVDNLIHIYGATIRHPDDLWRNVMAWMGGPVSKTATTGSTKGATVSGGATGNVGIPLVAQGIVTANRFLGRLWHLNEIVLDVFLGLARAWTLQNPDMPPFPDIQLRAPFHRIIDKIFYEKNSV